MTMTIYAYLAMPKAFTNVKYDELSHDTIMGRHP